MSEEHSIVLVGGPSSGKSNFLGRIWGALLNQEGALVAPKPPDKVEYVEGLLKHLLHGSFAPRSEQGLEDQDHDLTLTVAFRDRVDATASLVVPDVRGELWKRAVTASEIPGKWYERLQSSDSALLFVRAHSGENADPLDWVTARALLAAGLGTETESQTIPTQVFLCELLRILEATLCRTRRRPKVALVIAAWDSLDPATRDRSPYEFLDRQFPMLAGRLRDSPSVDLQVFGMSVLGGNVEDPAFRQTYLEGGGLSGSGYVVFGNGRDTGRSAEVTKPIQWLLS